MSIPGRDILWDVPTFFIVVMYGLFAFVLALFFYRARFWHRLVNLGESTTETRFDQPLRRVWLMFTEALAQRRVARGAAGWAHVVFYVGFLGLTFGTTIVFINSDVRDLFRFLFGVNFYFFHGEFYVFFKTVMDASFLLLLGGVTVAAVRRELVRPAVLAQPAEPRSAVRLEDRLGYWFPLLMLLFVALTGILLEGARINATGASASYAFIGSAVARLVGSLGAGQPFHRTVWFVHMASAFVLLAAIPLSKLRHLVMGPINLYFRNLNPRGRLSPISNFESADRYGVSRVEQYSWKQLLDLSSCLECGRCTINCPTATTGKALSPKFFIMNQRNHLLEQSRPLLSMDRANRMSVEPTRQLIGDIVHEQEVWDCTNCGWCEQACPVGIQPIQQIAELRRHLVLMEGRFPREATSAFKGIEVLGNPWGLPAESRFDWAKGLGVKEMSSLTEDESASIEVLYWVGCAGSYDERNKRVSRAFASVMQKAGVKFATLGRSEKCTGDPARRLGNEYLYATMATANLETLNRYKAKKIVTQCPHCYHNLKKEYPDFGRVEYEVVHEAEFLAELIEQKRLTLKSPLPTSLTYHDPCFMARHDQKWKGARSVLHAVPSAEVKEIEQSRERTYCCGAGGGCFWKEEAGKPRINETRFRQLTATTPEVIATGCPFCMTMLSDSTKQSSVDRRPVQVRDLVEIVAESAGLET